MRRDCARRKTGSPVSKAPGSSGHGGRDGTPRPFLRPTEDERLEGFSQWLVRCARDVCSLREGRGMQMSRRNASFGSCLFERRQMNAPGRCCSSIIQKNVSDQGLARKMQKWIEALLNSNSVQTISIPWPPNGATHRTAPPVFGARLPIIDTL